jgi:hypothetical protein
LKTSSPKTARNSASRFLFHRGTLALAIFLVAFGVRVLTWQDTRLEVEKVQTTVAVNYKSAAQVIRHEGLRGFFSSTSALAEPSHLGHPPGYSIFIAAIRAWSRDSDSVVQFAQIFFDALCAVLIFLIMTELATTVTAAITGLLAALSPQLAWNSVLLLPDSLSVFPVLLAVFVLTLMRRRPHLIGFLAVGALVGVSCWLRANAMFLTVFLALAAAVVSKSGLTPKRIGGDKRTWIGRRWRYVLAVIAGTLMIVLPLTIRNALVFQRFIPVSLGAGQTLLEGIADYDDIGRFDIPKTDLGIMNQEAAMFQRPDYARGLLEPDGIQRERWRLQRGFAVIRSHPLWFAGVMIQRAGSMLKLERARLVSTHPALSHSLNLTGVSPTEQNHPLNLLSAAGSSRSRVLLEAPESETLTVMGDDSSDGPQAAFNTRRCPPATDCVLEIPIRIESGRMRVSIGDTNKLVYASAIIEPLEGRDPQEQPTQLLRLPFVSGDPGTVVELNNEASPSPPLVHIGTIKIYELGPARFLWLRYPRLLIHGMQRVFLTAIILPLAIAGLVILIIRRKRDALIILSVIPLYYFCVQSIFHTEYRYVLAINYFLFAFAAVGVCRIAKVIVSTMAVMRKPKPRLGH